MGLSYWAGEQPCLSVVSTCEESYVVRAAYQSCEAGWHISMWLTGKQRKRSLVRPCEKLGSREPFREVRVRSREPWEKAVGRRWSRGNVNSSNDSRNGKMRSELRASKEVKLTRLGTFRMWGAEENQGWLLGFKNSYSEDNGRYKTTVCKSFMKVKIHKKNPNSQSFSLSAFESA